MTSVVENKALKILSGELKYKSANFAFNMMLARLQKKVQDDPECAASCIKEIDEFAAKYPKVATDDFAKISAL